MKTILILLTFLSTVQANAQTHWVKKEYHCEVCNARLWNWEKESDEPRFFDNMSVGLGSVDESRMIPEAQTVRWFKWCWNLLLCPHCDSIYSNQLSTAMGSMKNSRIDWMKITERDYAKKIARQEKEEDAQAIRDKIKELEKQLKDKK